MFDSGVDLGAVSTSALAGLIEQNHAELMVRECRTLELAAAWADRHYLDPAGGDYQPLVERACAYGGEGRRRCRSTAPPNWARCRGPGSVAARSVDRGRAGSAVPAAPAVGTGPDRWGAGLAGPQDRRGHPAVVVGGGVGPGPCAGGLRGDDAVAPVPPNPGRGDAGRRPGAGGGAGRAGPDGAGCVRLRLRGRPENHRRQSHRGGCGVVPGHGEPDRRHPRRPRRHRPGRVPPGPRRSGSWPGRPRRCNC